MKSQNKTSINTKTRNSNNSEVTINSTTINKTRSNNDSHFTKNRLTKNKKKKVLSQTNITGQNKSRTLYTQNQKKSNKTSMSNFNTRDSKLSPNNYIKPLYYLLYNQIRPINKQFLGYKDERYYLYYEYPMTLNTNSTIQNKDEKKEGNNSNNEVSNNNKNLRNKNNNRNNTNNSNERANESINLIQSCSRGYLARKMLNKSVSPYSQFRQDINTLEKIKQCKKDFLNKLKQFCEDYKNNKEKNSISTSKINSKLNSKINSDRSNKSKKKKVNYKRNTIFEADNSLENAKNSFMAKTVNKFKDINNNKKDDYDSKIKYNNKNIAIQKCEYFMISGYYKNNFDLFKNTKNGEFDKYTFDKEKELYENKLKELMEENKKYKRKRNNIRRFK